MVNPRYSEHDLQKQLSQAHGQLTQLKHSHDDSQARLIDHSSKYGEPYAKKVGTRVSIC